MLVEICQEAIGVWFAGGWQNHACPKKDQHRVEHLRAVVGPSPIDPFVLEISFQIPKDEKENQELN
jgi:hypothetical protein